MRISVAIIPATTKKIRAGADIHQPELLVIHGVDELLNDARQRSGLFSDTLRRRWRILLLLLYCSRSVSHNI